VRSSLAGACVLISALAAPSSAQVPDGAEFQVNTYTTGGQFRPAVAMLADGSFVVVWDSQGSPATDTSQQSIQGQRYAANGTPQGAQFQVNSYTTSSQLRSNVAAAPDGSFVVVWDSNGSSGTDNDSRSIQGQRYAANGSPQGAEFQVNTYVTGIQSSPAVATTTSGDFVVAWHSEGSSGTDASFSSIQAQRFASNGSPQGAEFQVNSYTTGFQYEPAVAVRSGGSFVVAWESQGSISNDTTDYSIQGQLFDAAGSPQGAQFQINTYTTGDQTGTEMAAAADGRFVVTWRSYGSFGTDTDGASTQARRYAANGTPQGAQFQVNTYTTEPQRFTSVAAQPNGDFVIAWVSDTSPGTDTSYRSIQGRRFVASGTPIGDQFQVNTYTTETQNFPAVAANDQGFVVAWQSYGSAGTDTSVESIQAQRYLPEPGATSALAAGVLLLLALRTRRAC